LKRQKSVVVAFDNDKPDSMKRLESIVESSEKKHSDAKKSKKNVE
jgi:hypothetical protein